jgi:hypothetical protein
MSARAHRRSLKMPDIRLQPIPALTYLRRPSFFAGEVHIRAVRGQQRLSVGIAAVTNGNDVDQLVAVCDAVDNAPLADADAPKICGAL